MSNAGDKGVPTLEALVQQGVRNALKDLHTAMPGIIDTFDPVTQTCTVQPAIKRIFVGGEAVALPVLINVPVSFPSAGGLSITLPVKQGDECLIIFSERSIDNWLQFGELKIPNDRRFHDLSDGIVIMGLKSNPNVLTDYDPENLVIRNVANDVKVTIGADNNIAIDTPGNIAMNAATQVDIVSPIVNINAETKVDIVSPIVNVDGDLAVTGAVTADTVDGSTDVTGGGISVKGHTHGYIGAGTGSSPQVSDPPS